MKTIDTLHQLREAVAADVDASFYDGNPHWSFGYCAERKKFWWSYECGCGLDDCAADHYDEYDTITELIESNACHLVDKPDYDDWHRNK